MKNYLYLAVVLLSAQLSLAESMDHVTEGTVYHIENQVDFDARASDVFAPGDQILFKRGAIFSGMFAPKGSGEPGKPIVIRSYGTGPLPIINAMGAHEAGILLKNVEHWEIHNMEVTNTDGSQDHQGKLKGIYVLIDNPPKTVMNHIHIRNCYVHDVNGTTLDDDKYRAKLHGGIHIHTVGENRCRINDLQVVGNTVERTGGVGIGTNSKFNNVTTGEIENLWTNVYVAHNFVNDTDRNNMIIRHSLNAIVEYNVLANSSRENTGHSLFNFQTLGFIAQNNEAYGNVGSGHDRGGYDADYNAKDTTYQYNYSHDNMWCIGIMNRHNDGVTIRYNISENDKLGFIFFGFNRATQSKDVKVYNNTYYAGDHLDAGEFIALNSRPHNVSLYNNIFYYANGASYGSEVLSNAVNFVVSHNAYIGIDPWPSDKHAVTNNIKLVDPGSGGTRIDMRDPNRLSGYRLQPGSACIDAGMSIDGVVQRDFWGNPVPAGSRTDIGAHEFQP